MPRLQGAIARCLGFKRPELGLMALPAERAAKGLYQAPNGRAAATPILQKGVGVSCLVVQNHGH